MAVHPVEIASWGIVALRKLRCYNGIMTDKPFHDLSDEQLIRDLKSAATRERHATAHLIELLAEMDSRKLYLAEGYSSLFVYCTQCLRLSEHSAYGRIEAARAARKFPIVLELLADGSMTLTAVCLLARHLTPENHFKLLGAAKHKSKRDVEQQIAALAPKAPVPTVVRRLPERKQEYNNVANASLNSLPARTSRPANDSPESTAPAVRHAPPVIAPLAPERYKVQFTISRETHDRLRLIQDLLRHVLPNGDPALIFDRALTLLLEDLERRKIARVHRPRQMSAPAAGCRHVPAAVRREVWARDEGRCAFVGTDGRCPERGFLEFHHVSPFAEGGPTSVDNLQLRCRAHNAYEAREHFGPMLFRERPAVDELGPDRVSSRHDVAASRRFVP